jgi:LCP family protein required for cell wall assembly
VTASDDHPAHTHRPRPRRRSALVLVLVLVAGGAAGPPGARLVSERVASWAHGEALVVIVEDALPADEPLAWVRAEERRADAVLVVRWVEACDRLQVASIPRDLILDRSGEPLSVIFGTGGTAAVERALATAFALDIAATVTMDLGDVREVADAVGPVEVTLRAPSRDQRTGFAGGPGPVVLDADTAVAYLRSRQWEESRGGEWVPVAHDDLGRIGREHAYLAAVLTELRGAGLADRVRLGVAVVRHGDAAIHRHLALVGLVSRLHRASDVEFLTVGVVAERSVDERRSPFSAGSLGAAHRFVLAPRQADVFRSDDCPTGAAAP